MERPQGDKGVRGQAASMQRFLAVHEIPAGTSEADFRKTLKRVADVADRVGIDVKETLFNLAEGRAWSIFEADTEEEIQQVARQAGLPAPEVHPAQIVYTELLSEPRRSR
jgi:hypothetical protein